MYGTAPKMTNRGTPEDDKNADDKKRTARIPSEMMRPSGRNNVPRTRRMDTATILGELIPGFKDRAAANARKNPWKRWSQPLRANVRLVEVHRSNNTRSNALMVDLEYQTMTAAVPATQNRPNSA
jgi:hypothetical protein